MPKLLDTPEPPTIDEPPEGSQLFRHPYVRLLRRENAGLRDTIKQISDLHREMTNRSLVVGRKLEPLNPAPKGILMPVPGQPTIVHVDALRIMYNRVMGTDDPTIRILVGGAGAEPLHAHHISLESCELRPLPTALPSRSGALVVLFTHEPVTVLR